MVVKDPTNETIIKKKMKVPGEIGCNVFNMVKHSKEQIDSSQDSLDVQKWTQVLSYCASCSPKPQLVKLASHRLVLIPAKSIKVVDCSTSRPTKVKNNTAMVQAVYAPIGSLPRSIMIINTCVENQDGHIPLRVANIGLEDV